MRALQFAAGWSQDRTVAYSAAPADLNQDQPAKQVPCLLLMLTRLPESCAAAGAFFCLPGRGAPAAGGCPVPLLLTGAGAASGSAAGSEGNGTAGADSTGSCAAGSGSEGAGSSAGGDAPAGGGPEVMGGSRKLRPARARPVRLVRGRCELSGSGSASGGLGENAFGEAGAGAEAGGGWGALALSDRCRIRICIQSCGQVATGHVSQS